MASGCIHGINNERYTNVDLDILVLEIECMLPDINTNNGGVGQEGVLVSSSSDLKTFSDGVDALKS